MRILLLHHGPLAQSAVGWLAWHWAQGLRAVSDEVQLLIVDDAHRFGEPLPIERVVCGDDPNADLRFGLPRFSAERGTGPTYGALSRNELAEYRERLRRRLDAVVFRFDPHVIHAQHVWLFGQLALETGVPYVVSAWPDELVDSRESEVLAALSEQAADNASRILVADEATRGQVEARFGAAREHTTIVPPEVLLDREGVTEDAQRAAGRWLHELYEAVLKERFG